MKRYRTLLVALSILLSGFALLPLTMPTLANAFHWQQYASAYGYPGSCYKLTAINSPANAGKVEFSPPPNCPNDSTRYRQGTPITLTAKPKLGYAFQLWTLPIYPGTYAANPMVISLTGRDLQVTAQYTSVRVFLLPMVRR